MSPQGEYILMFKCDACDRHFSTAVGLQSHTEAKGHTYRCDTCNSCFSDKPAAEQHMTAKRHWKHACQQCDYRSLKANKLQRHIAKHHGKKPVKAAVAHEGAAKDVAPPQDSAIKSASRWSLKTLDAFAITPRPKGATAETFQATSRSPHFEEDIYTTETQSRKPAAKLASDTFLTSNSGLPMSSLSAVAATFNKMSPRTRSKKIDEYASDALRASHRFVKGETLPRASDSDDEFNMLSAISDISKQTMRGIASTSESEYPLRRTSPMASAAASSSTAIPHSGYGISTDIFHDPMTVALTRKSDETESSASSSSPSNKANTSIANAPSSVKLSTKRSDTGSVRTHVSCDSPAASISADSLEIPFRKLSITDPDRNIMESGLSAVKPAITEMRDHSKATLRPRVPAGEIAETRFDHIAGEENDEQIKMPNAQVFTSASAQPAQSLASPGPPASTETQIHDASDVPQKPQMVASMSDTATRRPSECPYCAAPFQFASQVISHLESSLCPSAQILDLEHIYTFMSEIDIRSLATIKGMGWMLKFAPPCGNVLDHTDAERILRCEFCAQHFEDADALYRHHEQSHMPKLYRCPQRQCEGITFVRLAALFDHFEAGKCSFIQSLKDEGMSLGRWLQGDEWAGRRIRDQSRERYVWRRMRNEADARLRAMDSRRQRSFQKDSTKLEETSK